MRESPSLKLIEILTEKGAEVNYNDPYVPKLPKMRKYDFQMESVELTEENLKSYDLVLLSTDHDYYVLNSEFIKQNSKLLIDTRNALKNGGSEFEKVFKA